MKKWFFLLALLLLLLLLLSFGMAQATTYYVATTGDNVNNDCTDAQSPSTPKQTVNAGVGCLSGGDTLIVASGNYAETVSTAIPSGSGGAPTIVQAASVGGAVFQPGCGFCTVFDISNSYITVMGFVFDGQGSSKGQAIVLRNSAGNVTITSNEFKDWLGANNSSGTLGMMLATNGSGNVIRGNSFHDLGNNDVDGQCSSCYTYAIYLPTSGVLIENNTFYNISGYAIHMYSSGAATDNNVIRTNHFYDVGTILIAYGTSSTGNLVYNNLLERVGTTVYPYDSAGIRVHRDSNEIYNNTIVDGGGDCILLDGDSNTVRNNICYGNSSDNINDGGSGNTKTNNLLGTNPQFVNAGSGDYRLNPANSPAIDAGYDTSATVKVDRDGWPRPQGSAVDQGAYEDPHCKY